MSRANLELLNTSTAKEQSIVEKFRSRSGPRVLWPRDQKVVSAVWIHTPGLHQAAFPHTDESLEDCSFLSTCFHMDTCKICPLGDRQPPEAEGGLMGSQAWDMEVGLYQGEEDRNVGKLFTSQWICCGIRVLGKLSVVMADPPWDIHMGLPYGTLTDNEMRKLHTPFLQDDGFLFLWVTGSSFL
ncbi:N(6)-adenosine-methyltransferase subunit METTL3-like [Salvelinus alpinus]